MKNKTVLIGASALAAVALLGGWAMNTYAAAEDEAAAPDLSTADLSPVMATSVLMEYFFEPMQESLKASVAQEPADRKGWVALWEHANAAAELATLTMLREGPDESTPEWDAMSKEVKIEAIKLADAARNKDFASVQSGYTSLIQKCNVCHEKLEAKLLEP